MEAENNCFAKGISFSFRAGFSASMVRLQGFLLTHFLEFINLNLALP